MFINKKLAIPFLLAVSLLTGCGLDQDVVTSSYITYQAGGWFPSKINGSGNVITANRSDILKDVSLQSIALVGVGSFSIEEGEKDHFEVIAEDNIVPKVQTNIINGMLTCQLQSGFSYTLHKPYGLLYRLTLTKERLRMIHTLQTSGGAKLCVNAPLDGNNDLTVDAQGASRITMNNLSVHSLRVIMSGAAKVAAKIVCIHKLFSLRAQGAGQVEIETIDAPAAQGIISTVGSTHVEIGEGSLQSCEIASRGASHIRAFKVQCAQGASIKFQGVSSVHINNTRYTK